MIIKKKIMITIKIVIEKISVVATTYVYKIYNKK